MEWLVIIGILWLVSIIIYRKSEGKDSKKWYDSEVPVIGHPTIVDDILGHCVLPPIVEPKKPYKRPVDKSVNPFDEQYQIAEPTKRLSNQFMSAQDKYAYMFSNKWFNLRSAVFERDSYTCQSCGSKHYLRCHHIDYSMLGDEPLHHLITLCDTCHTDLHKQLGYDRTTIYNIKDNS